MENLIRTITELQDKYARVLPTDENHPFPLVSYLEMNGAEFKNIFVQKVPEDLRFWWNTIKSAILFKDVEYGQWGLRILSEEMSFAVTSREMKEVPSNFKSTDIILGEFIGDLEMLLINCDPDEDYGSVYVVLEIYDRSHWPKVADNFSGFLEQYVSAQGDKYWEPS